MSENSPNVLFIFSDEHDPRHMGVSGSALVKTPNLDALAARGTRFTKAITPCPICVPARASLATGLAIHDNGCWDNAIAYTGEHEGWCHALAKAGHRIESIGKLHYVNDTDPTGFDRQHSPMHIWDGIGMVWASVRDPLPTGRKMRQMLKDIGPGLCSYNEYDLEVTGRTVQWLHERANSPDPKPWALFCGLVSPHFPLVAPPKYFDLYPLEDIPHSKLLPADGFEHHPWIARREQYMGQDHFFDDDPERRKLAIAAYFALCTFLDDNVGRILRALEESGQLENTLVIYTSDHGDNIGQRGLWGKSNMYRESCDIPMVLAGPGVPRGEVNSTTASLNDIHATILDAMGVADLDDGLPRQSESLLQVLGSNNEDRIVLSQYHAAGAATGAFMVQDARYKYNYYVDYPPEFFDLEKDPEETTNLASDPACAAQIKRLHAALEQQLGDRTPETVDRMAKDSQNALIESVGGREAAQKLGTPGATPAPGRGHE